MTTKDAQPVLPPQTEQQCIDLALSIADTDKVSPVSGDLVTLTPAELLRYTQAALATQPQAVQPESTTEAWMKAAQQEEQSEQEVELRRRGRPRLLVPGPAPGEYVLNWPQEDN